MKAILEANTLVDEFLKRSRIGKVYCCDRKLCSSIVVLLQDSSLLPSFVLVLTTIRRN
jgi:hypothetical protein